VDNPAAEVFRIEIARLDIQRGELLLVQIPDKDYSDEVAARISATVQPALPSGVRLLVAPKSAEFSVISG
jgi:hypothetical protein